MISIIITICKQLLILLTEEDFLIASLQYSSEQIERTELVHCQNMWSQYKG